RHGQVAEDAFDLFEIVLIDSLAPAVTALQAVEDMLPDRAGRLQPLVPLAAPLQFPHEGPLPGELLGAEEPPLSGFRPFIGPLDLDRHGLTSPRREPRPPGPARQEPRPPHLAATAPAAPACRPARASPSGPLPG